MNGSRKKVVDLYRDAGQLVVKAKRAERRSDWDGALDLYDDADGLLKEAIMTCGKARKDLEKEQYVLFSLNDLAERRQVILERALKSVEKAIKRDKERF